MDASFGLNQLGTNEALADTPILSQTPPSFATSINETKRYGQSIKRILKSDTVYENHGLVSTQYIKHNNEKKSNKCTIQNSAITQDKTVSNVTASTTSFVSIPRSINPDTPIENICLNTDRNDCHFTQNHMDTTEDINPYSVRSVSSPQLTIKPVAQSKVCRKASLKSMNLSNSTLDNSVPNHRKSNDSISDTRIIDISNCSITFADKEVPFSCLSETTQGNDTRNKWNTGEVHITCNPLSTPYPYSTPHRNIMSETVTEPLDDEPKTRSCGSFLPILSLIPQTVISFQYLSPKMKFSWWRNKIS
ncbi:uncharacterized protein LOC128876229 [Hylaeus volcanicus]|uniref:uncharacterized protein LOC128876229 n=1 Tax=Hylaeus volcanicus TaxID=313075 RepID=UPI0023B7C5B9|nr:uncharacterized protein LOC128876229 [Hylaeus volcanicus]